MNILSISNYYTQNNISSLTNNRSSKPVFGSRQAQKMLEKVIKSKNWKELKFTFDDVVNMYSELGYQTFVQRSSHAIVRVGDYNIPLVMPHGNQKIVKPMDLKRLKLVALGNIDAAAKI